MTTSHVAYSVTDRVAEIRLERPATNAIDHPMIDGILAALGKAREDPSVRAVVISSALESMFCSGMDLSLMVGVDAAEFRRFLDKLYIALYDTQYRLGKPTICAINGPARGAGVTLAVSCDMVVASDNATLGYPEIHVGLIPGIHYVHLPRQVGRHAAFELLFLGKPITAQRAEEIGLINRAVPAADLRATALKIASDLTRTAPELMKVGRNAFYRINDLDYRRSIEGVVDTLCGLITSPESQEGLRAFMEKRAPQW